MEDEMFVLVQNEIRELVSLLAGKKAAGCRWVYSVKLNLDETLAHPEACLLVKGYSHIYGINY